MAPDDLPAGEREMHTIPDMAWCFCGKNQWAVTDWRLKFRADGADGSVHTPSECRIPDGELARLRSLESVVREYLDVLDRPVADIPRTVELQKLRERLRQMVNGETP